MLEIKNVSPICLIDENSQSLTVDGVKALFSDGTVDVVITSNVHVAIVQPKTENVAFKMSVLHRLSFSYGGTGFNTGASGVVTIPRAAIPDVVYHFYMD